MISPEAIYNTSWKSRIDAKNDGSTVFYTDGEHELSEITEGGPSGPTVGAIYGQLCQAPMMYIYIVPLSQGVNISINNFSIYSHA